MDSGEVGGHDREDIDVVDGPANVLVLTEGIGDESRRAYFETVAPTDPGRSRVLAVNYTRTPDDWLTDWRRYVGAHPAECVIVSVGESVRATVTGPEAASPVATGHEAVGPEATAPEATGTGDIDADRSEATEDGDAVESTDGTRRIVRGVDTPDDLTGLGIAIGEYLSEWADADADAGANGDANAGANGDPDETEGAGEVVLVFDSLTVLLQYVDLQRAFRFLHVMTNRARTAGASSFFHLNPDAHDRQTVVTLASLFDTVLEYEGDGEWSTSPR